MRFHYNFFHIILWGVCVGVAFKDIRTLTYSMVYTNFYNAKLSFLGVSSHSKGKFIFFHLFIKITNFTFKI